MGAPAPTAHAVVNPAFIRCTESQTSISKSRKSIELTRSDGVRTYKRGTANRGQLIAGQLIARTHNRADT